MIEQKNLPEGATIAPIIIASDKTQLTQFRGDKSAWPVYISIGNIAKAKRREVSAQATEQADYISRCRRTATLTRTGPLNTISSCICRLFSRGYEVSSWIPPIPLLHEVSAWPFDKSRDRWRTSGMRWLKGSAGFFNLSSLCCWLSGAMSGRLL